jgi:membrane-associated phospholipid phosphatase
MELKKIYSRFNRTELVALAFIIYFLVQIIFQYNSLNFAATRWSAFPRMDIFFILVAVFVLKLTRNQTVFRILCFVFLLLAYFGFTGFSKDFFLPLYKIIPAFIENILISLRFLFLFSFIITIYFAQKKKQENYSLLLKDLRLFIPFFIIVFLYPLIPLIIKAGIIDKDSTLMKWDSFIFFGTNPLLWLEKIVSIPLTEFLSFTYSFYGPFFGLLIGLYFLEEKREALEELLFMSTAALAIGYIFYTLVPAVGPLYTQAFNVNLDLNLMKEIKFNLMDKPRIDRDCFPSLHTTISLLTLFSAYKNKRNIFWVLLPLIITIPFACVYLRYHYVVDVLAGIILFIALAIFTNKNKKGPLT